MTDATLSVSIATDSRGLKDLQAEDAGFLPKPYTLESLAFEVAQALNGDA